MNKPHHQKRLIQAMALAGIALNFIYGAGLLYSFFSLRFSNEIKEILISAIALEFGWAALLTRAVVRPLESRHLLFFTGISMMFGNLLLSIHQWLHLGNSTGAIATHLLLGTVVAGLFVLTCFISQPLRQE